MEWFGLKINGELKAVQAFSSIPLKIYSFHIPYDPEYYKEGTIAEIVMMDVEEKDCVLKMKMKDRFFRTT